MDPPRLSIVVPAFNEADNLLPLVDRLEATIDDRMTLEVVIVDDGSRDGTYERAVALADAGRPVRALRLSRNFGHQAALLAGLHHAGGEAVIMMDADLQHPPETIPELLDAWERGYQVVHTVRRDTRRSAGPLKRLTSSAFYRVLHALSGLEIRPGMADFRLIDRRALEPVLKQDESLLFLRGLFIWVGFRQTHVEYEAAERLHGMPAYTSGRMIRFAVHAILSFSAAPLYWSMGLGVLVAGLAASYGAYAIGVAVFTDLTVPGWTSQVALTAFLLGIQLVMMGLLGAYVAAIYEEVKGRPQYLVAEDTAER